MSCIVLRSILVDTCSDDEEGQLVMANGRLIGVAVRLAGEESGTLRGCWSLEAGFGPLELARPEPFASLEGLQTWADALVEIARTTRR